MHNCRLLNPSKNKSMLLKLSYTELLNLVTEAKNKTLKENFYHCIAYDTNNGKFGVYNVVFLDTCEELKPLYTFNEEEHSDLNINTNCDHIVHREIMHSGLKSFAIQNKCTLKFSYNGMILQYSLN